MILNRKTTGLIALILSLCISNAYTRTADGGAPPVSPTTAASPAHCIAAHNIGKLNMSISNNGTFGTNYSQAGVTDCFTGQTLLACEYPKGSNTRYNYGSAFWIGAVSGRDTLVSTGADGWDADRGYELNPAEAPIGDMIYRSTIDPAKPEYDGAVSEQDYVSVYTDTCTNCPGTGSDIVDNRPHRPLNIEVTQKSFAWSYSYAEDFVLFDYAIRNIGHERLRNVFMGVYVDADVHGISNADGYDDDICGFRHTAPSHYLPAYCPPDSDVVNIAWIADNDGDLSAGTDITPVPHVTGVRIVRTPADSLEVSFNWWIGNSNPSLDFGPQTRAKQRDLGTGGTGTPEGDRNKYYFMQNGEFDYDQIRTASIDPLDPVWLPPPANHAADWADGKDTRYLLSFGPFDIEPGQTLPLSFAYVAGENLHTEPSNIDNLPDNWQAYYENLDFSDLEINATWADWIYDNPGVDSDHDSNYGEFKVCNLGSDSTLTGVDTTLDTVNTDPLVIDTTLDSIWEYDLADTIWYRGDNVPDFQGASPPPGPATYTSYEGVAGLRVKPSVGKIRVLWNGAASETARDVFSREYDFEGYRVYLGRDDRRLSYSLMASYDLEDYNKYTWDPALGAFRLFDSPYKLNELRALYGNGDPEWDPLNYSRSRPYVMDDFPDSVFYFEPQDYNRSILANDPVNANTPIKKVFPEAPQPPTLVVDSIPDTLRSLYLTKDGFFKYYEYEYTIEDLLPTVPYWINVTAFDYGSPRSGLSALETNPTVRPVVTYPLESNERVEAENLEVYVYPNPYRIDANYRARGFEGRSESDRPVDRTRRIHFANLPPKCTIRIWSLDGDMIREIVHDVDPADPMANHDTWNLITRNTQLVVSGLYYWTVEDDQGRTQVGKLAIIL